MQLGVLKETHSGEKRVAISPETIKKYVQKGLDVVIESGAGDAAGFPDHLLKDAGAKIEKDFAKVLSDSDIVLKVHPLSQDRNELKSVKKGGVVLGLYNPFAGVDAHKGVEKTGASIFSMDAIPRISRAQSMDVLSSQSNLAGYRAVIESAEAFGRAFPMMMTAAGTVAPARVLVVGAGVAGLQAVATAKRLGAIVSAFDVRAAAKEQVESLGGKFIEVESDENLETSGGYAKETSDDYKKRQAEKVAKELQRTDIVITTALIPGRPAPRIITKAMVNGMAPGSVILDMAAVAGGNVEGSKADETVETENGVKILGFSNLPSRIAKDTSQLYAKNILNFLNLMIDEGEDKKPQLKINKEDEIIAKTLIAEDGKFVFGQDAK